MKTWKHGVGWFVLCVSLAFFLGLSLEGCGRKGDPIPPGMVPLPAVEDLKISAGAGGGIQLSWTMPKEETDISRIRILRSDLEIAGEECPGCPRQYGILAELSLRNARLQRAGAQGVRYIDDDVKRGWLYTYKIVLCDFFGSCGRDSRPVELKVKSE